MQVNLSGEYGLVRLKEIAEDLQDRFEQIPRCCAWTCAAGWSAR
jgi:multidrug efflux pump